MVVITIKNAVKLLQFQNAIVLLLLSRLLVILGLLAISGTFCSIHSSLLYLCVYLLVKGGVLSFKMFPQSLM